MLGGPRGTDGWTDRNKEKTEKNMCGGSSPLAAAQKEKEVKEGKKVVYGNGIWHENRQNQKKMREQGN